MMRQRTILVSMTGIICATIATSVWADDLIHPPWRGDDGTTYQNWKFDVGDKFAVPEIINNPYGTASATIDPKPLSDGWYASVLGRVGVWGDLESITLQIDNRLEPLPYKEIWIQVTYYLPPNNEPVVNVLGASYLGGETRQLESYGPGSWYLQQSMWRIEPNPQQEVIEITTGLNGMTIDQIVIDTICEAKQISLDIMPSDCPNLFTVNLRSQGRLPVALIGTESFDVSEVVLDSISIGYNAFPVKQPSVEDVSKPVAGDLCNCVVGVDGINDLVIHFSRRDVILTSGLDMEEPGTVVPITVTGFLLNGAPFESTDCVELVGN